jgi:hypothetical protein
MVDIIDRTLSLLPVLFQQLPVPYVVIGGFAVNVWGLERATLDVDVMVGGRTRQFELLTTLVVQYGLDPQAQFLEANPLLRGVVFRCRTENFHVDFLRSRDAHDRQVLRRRREETFAGHRLWFPAPEDLILMKLKVGRDRDFDDAMRIVEQNTADLNYHYLARWGRKLGVEEELTYVLRPLG